MNLTILNRDLKHPADGWYPIEAKGYFPGVAEDGRKIVQVIDDKAVTSIVNRFNASATSGKLPHGGEMLIDREHFRHHRDSQGQKDMDSAAYGWIKQLRAGADGLEMKNTWTGVGQSAVDTGVYRFVSTEYDETNPGDVWEPVKPAEIPLEVRNKYPATDGWEFMRPLQLTGLSLTNDNNNKGGKPLTILNKTTMLNGDTVGHEFHGNQWAAGEAGASRLEAHKQNQIASAAPNHEVAASAARRAGEAADNASSAANNRGDQASHNNAMVASREAKQAHEGAASMTDDKKEIKFHESEAARFGSQEKFHAGKIGILNRKTFAGSREPADSAANKQPKNKEMKNVNAELGLAAEAEESSAVAAIIKLKNRIATLEPLEATNLQLKNRVSESDGEQCDALMDAHGLKADAPQRATLKPVLLGMKNRAERVAFLTECVAKPAAPPTQQRGQTQLHNRDTKAPGTSAGTSDESGEAKAIAIHNRVQELQGKGLKCVAATAQATREFYAGQIK